MAEIDKVLPNVEQTINVPNPQDVEIAEQEKLAEQGKPPVDVQQNEDGSADITFDPRSMSPGQDTGHFANLAELLPDDVLDPLGAKLFDDYTEYKNSRRDWEKTYTEGLDLLGFKYQNTRTKPFRGSSDATHPVSSWIKRKNTKQNLIRFFFPCHSQAHPLKKYTTMK